MADGKSAGVIAKRAPSLTDLFKVGEEVVFNDGVNEVTVWVQKLTQSETKEAAEKSRPFKSTINSIKRLRDDDPRKLVYYDQVESAGLDSRDDWIRFLISSKLQEAQMSAEARVAAEDEWAKDDYLRGLEDAWLDGLDEAYAADPDDEQASRVFSELRRYSQTVEREVDAAREELINEIDDLPDEELLRRCINKYIEDISDRAMINEFRAWQIYLGTRKVDNHDELYFSDRSDIDKLVESVYNKLENVYLNLGIDGIEGKD